ncbi:hypothetical protein BpHYR1_027792 [Brachionus plicatilis]|uniref:Uncharacterized protein n=1 Tax=Brachionus plicatilis TaxID=10195 RepID=A0A3M7RUM7_BRAPC|nr:hypothetical protein BpHYR1_027792 [Brachionus plicatilis]
MACERFESSNLTASGFKLITELYLVNFFSSFLLDFVVGLAKSGNNFLRFAQSELLKIKSDKTSTQVTLYFFPNKLIINEENLKKQISTVLVI